MIEINFSKADEFFRKILQQEFETFKTQILESLPLKQEKENPPDLISIGECQLILKRSRPTIYALARRRVITPFRIKGQRGYMFDRQEILQTITKIQFRYAQQKQ